MADVRRSLTSHALNLLHQVAAAGRPVRIEMTPVLHGTNAVEELIARGLVRETAREGRVVTLQVEEAGLIELSL